VNPLFTSSPSRVVREAINFAASGSLWFHAQTSIVELLTGFALAAAVAVPLSIVAGWNRVLYAALNPFIGIGYVMPRIALVPLITLWFGIGLSAKVALVVIMVTFPVMIVVIEGVRKVDADLVRVGRAFGASSANIFLTIILPASVPYVIAGLKIGYGLGVVGVVVGELYGSTSGLGYVLVSAGAVYRTDLLFVAVLALVVIGLVGMAILSWVERIFSSWRPARV
jgi:NitT/TauT family transport system permease protein